MFDRLINSPIELVVTILAVAVANYFVSLAATRAQSSQPFVEFEEFLPPGPAGVVRSPERQLALPLLSALPACILAFFVDHVGREVIGGGYLVMQLAALALNIGTFTNRRTLANPRAAEGHIRYSAMYRYRSQAGLALGLAFFAASASLLLLNLAFAVGAAFLLAASIGYLRRSRLAQRRSRPNSALHPT